LSAKHGQTVQGLVALVGRSQLDVGLDSLKQRLDLFVKGQDPSLVTGVQGRKQPVHRPQVATVVGLQGDNRVPVSRITVLVQILDRGIQGSGCLRKARP